MAMDEATLAHQEWLGYLQPVGLVVSPYALHQAQAFVDRNLIEPHGAFLAALGQWQFEDQDAPESAIVSWRPVAQQVLGWAPTDLVGEGGQPLPEDLCVPLVDHGEVLRPTYAVPDPSPPKDGSPWLMLIQELRPGTLLDQVPHEGDGWLASPMARFERLLRETQVPTGLLLNGRVIRLVHAPRGETSGYLDFKVADMEKVSGRPIFGAFTMLLGAERLFVLPDKQRLPAILADSRKYQSEVSTKLAEQVLGALYELLRGFQAADEGARGQLLKDVLAKEPSKVYAGLLTVLLRMVFLLFAEDRGKEAISDHEVYLQHYSVLGLYDQLREDAARYPDTMDLRFGAWARMLSLFRLIYDGAHHQGLNLPARHGHLFDPDRFAFLEGRPEGSKRLDSGRLQVPQVSDGVLYRVLTQLLLLDGERLSYRTLDVEQIGSVYESMMGFTLRIADGPTLAIKSPKPQGAPTPVNLDNLLQVPTGTRDKWLKKATGQNLTGRAKEALAQAADLDALELALAPKVNRAATPVRAAAGTLVLVPSLERRQSGSNYTPRSLTAPIVRKTLAPVLEALGDNPTPTQILGLRVLDPAVGSAAFLVEACRQLAEALVAAWRAHNCMPKLPPDEDELLHARRVIAQRCLYGVDRNPMAVDLAKLSLWLVTLAKDHPFTFLDHAIRCGDSVVGVWLKDFTTLFFDEEGAGGAAQQVRDLIAQNIMKAQKARRAIQDAGDDVEESLLLAQMAECDQALDTLRVLGDALVHCYFMGRSARDRRTRRSNAWALVHQWLSGANDGEELRAMARELRGLEHPVNPFHWELEFPEVFLRVTPGFDAIVGNPPFAGKNTVIAGNAENYQDWLLEQHPCSHGNADLAAHFFRRAFDLLRPQGSFGLIATNTISQGDTRNTGLRWIRTHGGTIYSATRRLPWPGAAAVVVSIVHGCKGDLLYPFDLDGRPVDLITAFLFRQGPDNDPHRLVANEGKSFIGSYVLGMGFTFDDTDRKGVASNLATMKALIAADPRNRDRIFPYIGGEEVLTDPEHRHHRWVINFGDDPLTRRQLSPSWRESDLHTQQRYLQGGAVPLDYPGSVAEDWPDLLQILRAKVYPNRAVDNRASYRKYWWRFAERRPELYPAIQGLPRVMVSVQTSKYRTITFLPSKIIYGHKLVVFSLSSFSAFAVMQSGAHEHWAIALGSSMKDDPVYTPSDCFETFPFPMSFEDNPDLEEAGRMFYELRAALMVKNQQGLTAIYNRFHGPEERDPGILKLREHHQAMDELVVNAYGWSDLRLTYGFFPDFEPAEDEDDEAPRTRIRYRWPNELREEVLARLLALNAQRAAEERTDLPFTETQASETLEMPKKRGRKPKTMPPMAAGSPTLFDGHPEVD